MAKKNTAVIYARYSTDIQNDKSIDDQVLLCRDIASRHGYKVTAVYTDRAKSSATLFDRDGLLELMQAAKRRAFDAVISESTDRISRDPEDLPGVVKRLRFNDIKIIDLNGDVTDIHVGIRGIMGPMFLKDLGNKVRRHHLARVREGKKFGSTDYGYRPVAGKPGEREIDPAQAKIVRRIFEEYTAGKSPRDIAAALSRDGIPSPSGNKHWHHASLRVGGIGRRGMLGNEIYIGRLVWNCQYTTRNPENGRRVKRANKPEDMITTEVPHLRIIDQSLWDRAHGVCKDRTCSSRAPWAARRAMKDSILSGLLVCAACGSHMRVVHTIANGVVRVACSASLNHSACSHTKSYDGSILERTVLDGVKKHLTSPQALLEYTRSYHARWAERQKEARSDRTDVQKALNKVTVQIDRYVTAIGESDDPVQGLVEKLKKLETERVGLTERLRLIERETNIVSLHPQVIQKFCTSIEELHTALSVAVSTDQSDRFRVAFRNLFDRIVVHPTEKRKPYEVTPFVRLSAVMGIELFPKMRSAKEMLAEQGVAYSTSGRSTTSRRPGTDEQSGVISFGRWRAAA